MPFRVVGQAVWIRGGARTVAIYTQDHALIATHDRAREPGQRQTLLTHLPPEKVAGVVLSRESCQRQAAAIGPATATVVQQLLDHRPEDRLRRAARLLHLAATDGAERLERACARAQHFGAADYPAVKRILAAGRDGDPLPAASPPAPLPRYTFVRQAGEFVASLWGGAR